MAFLASLAQHLLSKREVLGSNPTGGSCGMVSGRSWHFFDLAYFKAPPLASRQERLALRAQRARAWLSWQSTRSVSGRSWVRIPLEPCSAGSKTRGSWAPRIGCRSALLSRTEKSPCKPEAKTKARSLIGDVALPALTCGAAILATRSGAAIAIVPELCACLEHFQQPL